MRNPNPSEASTGFIVTGTFSKFLVNTAKRLLYPFAPALARGLGVDVSAVTAIIAGNQATSLVAPLIVYYGDRIGLRLLLLASMALLTAAMFAAGLIPVYIVFMIALLLAGISKSIIDPTLQGLVGNLVPFDRRGKVIGIMETAWAASTLAGIPLAGMLIQRFGWQTPFLVIGCLSLASLAAIFLIFPGDRHKTQVRHTGPDLLTVWRRIIRRPDVRSMLVFVFFMCLANDNLFVVYGIWLEASFSLSLVAIGAGAFFIGLAELSGEFLTALVSDRIGLKRAIGFGAFLTSGSYLFLMLPGMGLVTALAGLFVLFLTFEFTIVTSMSLSTELVPGFRASVMSAYFAVASLGRVLGAFSGGLVWERFGIAGVGAVSGLCTLVAFLALVLAAESPAGTGKAIPSAQGR